MKQLTIWKAHYHLCPIINEFTFSNWFSVKKESVILDILLNLNLISWYIRWGMISVIKKKSMVKSKMKFWITGSHLFSNNSNWSYWSSKQNNGFSKNKILECQNQTCISSNFHCFFFFRFVILLFTQYFPFHIFHCVKIILLDLIWNMNVNNQVTKISNNLK